MITLVLLASYVAWVVISLVGYKAWQYFVSKKITNKRIGIVCTVIWLLVSFWFAGGQKYWWDMKVDRLCLQDGGITIYETVELPYRQTEHEKSNNRPFRR